MPRSPPRAARDATGDSPLPRTQDIIKKCHCRCWSRSAAAGMGLRRPARWTASRRTRSKRHVPPAARSLREPVPSETLQTRSRGDEWQPGRTTSLSLPPNSDLLSSTIKPQGPNTHQDITVCARVVRARDTRPGARRSPETHQITRAVGPFHAFKLKLSSPWPPTAPRATGVRFC